jgi:hypothetical protein
MKKLVLFAVWFCFAVFARAANTPDPATYTETLHVTSSYLVPGGQQLEVVTNGKNYTLLGSTFIAKVKGIGGLHTGVLPIGDYKARLIPENYQPSYILFLSYEMLLPDGKTAKFTVVGEKE